jgi:competence CoiA-like predicted nuclease
MQIAIDTNGKRMLAYNEKNGDNYLCPICGGSVVLRQGSINIAHFVLMTV